MKEEAAEETPREYYFLLWLTGAVIFAAMVAIYLYVPTEKTEGAVQRIMYFHIPSAWLSFFAFFVVFLCSILFLWKRDREWDIYAHASAEIGVIFCSLVLITGPIWARPIWGAWWVWDARLTSTLILWLIYVAYLMPVANRTRFHASAVRRRSRDCRVSRYSPHPFFRFVVAGVSSPAQGHHLRRIR